MVDRLKMYINRLIADSVKRPDAAINFRGQAYGALMFVLEDETLTDGVKTELVHFWDGAFYNFNDIYNNYIKEDN